MSASAGRVLILLKGEYNNSVQYQMLDAVKYQGSLYIARKTTLGNVPQEGEYWMLSAVGGQWGEIGGTLADQLDLKTALDGKQATLTFDNTPTASSTNPVTSDGIKTAIDTKITNPGGGSVGDVLKKTANGEEWATETASAWGSITGTLSDQTDLQNVLDGKAGIGSIATIEANFATTAHSVGEYVYWNGHLYEVIAAIAANEALIDGTNVTAVSVGDELSSLKSGLTNLTTTVNDKANLGNVYTRSIVGTGSSNRIRIRNGLAASTFLVMSMDRRTNGKTITATVQFYDGTASVDVLSNNFTGTFSVAIDAYGILVTLPNTQQSVIVIGLGAFTLDIV